jgi:LPS O-antigen subunit length determinant protein (WzzB/FepE family)
MEDEIDLRDIFRVLWKRRQLIIGVFVVAVLVAGVISFAMPSVYKISSIITAGNFDDPVYTSQASMKNIIHSDEFAQEVFEQVSPNATGSEFRTFKDSVKVEPVKDSDKLIEISVETKNKQEGLKAIEKMIWLYANRSEDSYYRHKKILSDQLAVTLQRLDVINLEINQTQEALQEIQDSTGSSAVQGEMQFSRTLDRLSGMQNQRSTLIDRSLDLQKQLVLIRNLEVVQLAKEPVSPIGPRKALIVAIGGMLGLMIGIFAAFLREGFGWPVE